MSCGEEAGRQGDAQARLRAWKAGDGKEPFEAPLEEVHCICESALPRSAGDAAMILRAVLMAMSNNAPGSTLKAAFARLAGMKIGKGVFISPKVLLDPLYPNLIEIGDEALLGIGCRMISHEYTSTRFRLGRIRIGRKAVIGAYSTIRSGVTVGEGATIGMHSFVNRDVGPWETVAGVPARKVRARGEGA